MKISANANSTLNITKHITHFARKHLDLITVKQSHIESPWSLNSIRFYNTNKTSNETDFLKDPIEKKVNESLDVSSVLPVALLDLNPSSSFSTKLLLVPLNWNSNDVMLKKSIAEIISKRKTKRQIITFTNIARQLRLHGRQLQEQADLRVKEIITPEENHTSSKPNSSSCSQQHFDKVEAVSQQSNQELVSKHNNLSLDPKVRNHWDSLFTSLENLENMKIICSTCLTYEKPTTQNQKPNTEQTIRGRPVSLSDILSLHDLKLSYDKFQRQQTFSNNPLNLNTNSFGRKYLDFFNEKPAKDAETSSKAKYVQASSMANRSISKKFVATTAFQNSSRSHSSKAKNVIAQISRTNEKSKTMTVYYNSPFVMELLGGHKLPMSRDTYLEAIVEAERRRAMLKLERTNNGPLILKDSQAPCENGSDANVIKSTTDSFGSVKSLESSYLDKKLTESLEQGEVKRDFKKAPSDCDSCRHEDPFEKVEKSPSKKSFGFENMHINSAEPNKTLLRPITPLLQMTKGSSSGDAGIASHIGGDQAKSKSNPCKSDSRKTEKQTPCDERQGDYRPKCNADPCSNIKAKGIGDETKSKKQTSCDERHGDYRPKFKADNCSNIKAKDSGDVKVNKDSDKTKSSACKSDKDKLKNSSTCGDVANEYKPKCNADPCDSAVKSVKSDSCLKKPGPCTSKNKQETDISLKRKKSSESLSKNINTKAKCSSKEDKMKSDSCLKKPGPCTSKPKQKSDISSKTNKSSESLVKNANTKAKCSSKKDKKKAGTCSKNKTKTEKSKSNLCLSNKTSSLGTKNIETADSCAKKEQPTSNNNGICSSPKQLKETKSNCAQKSDSKIKEPTKSCAKDNRTRSPCTNKKDMTPYSSEGIQKKTDTCAKGMPISQKIDSCLKKDSKQSDSAQTASSCNKKPKETKPNCGKKEACAKDRSKDNSSPRQVIEKSEICTQSKLEKVGTCLKKESKQSVDNEKDSKKSNLTSDNIASTDDKKPKEAKTNCGQKVKETCKPISEDTKIIDSERKTKQIDACAKDKKIADAKDRPMYNPSTRKGKSAQCQDSKLSNPHNNDHTQTKPKDNKTSTDCAKNLKETKPNCKAQKSTNEKCFSTFALCQRRIETQMNAKYFHDLQKNFYSTVRNMNMNKGITGFAFRRQYSKKVKKDIDQGISSKCKSMAVKKPANRRKDYNPHPKDGLRKCYPTYDMECPKPLCNDPRQGGCSKYAFLKDTNNHRRSGKK